MASEGAGGTIVLDRVLPFSAVVGQNAVKRALVLAAVNRRLGGVLIRGEKGTAKSTAARALARLLPPIEAREGCRYACDPARPAAWCADCRGEPAASFVARRPPFETLPLGITEDQLLGTIDLEHALRHGEQRFSPGLLARVHRGVLYVDEVNLLEDHIVDLLLDVAASGVNVVAREGVAANHPAEFMLVGTMNPEEGDLRPQLLDRFGLCVEIAAIADPEVRAEVSARWFEFEANPEGFRRAWEGDEAALAHAVAAAREVLPRVRPDRRWHRAAARTSLALGVDGHRADILMIKTAATLAALAGREEIAETDFEEAAVFVYPHRIKRKPFEERSASSDELRAAAREAARESARDAPAESPPAGPERRRGDRGSAEEEPETPGMGRGGKRGGDAVASRSLGGEKVHAVRIDREGLFGDARPTNGSGDAAESPLDEAVGADAFDASGAPPTGGCAAGGARSGASDVISRRPFRGRYARAVPARGVRRDLAFDAALRETAHLQPERRSEGNLAVSLRLDEIPRKLRVERRGRLVLFVVDASGSMGGELMRVAKSAALGIARRAYVERERVAMVAFRGAGAELLFGPTTRAERIHRALAEIPCGGTTPLAEGLVAARDVLRKAALRRPAEDRAVVLVTDGRANVGARRGYAAIVAEVEEAARALAAEPSVRVLMLDATEAGKHDFPARTLAERLGAKRLSLARIVAAGESPAEALHRLL